MDLSKTICREDFHSQLPIFQYLAREKMVAHQIGVSELRKDDLQQLDTIFGPFVVVFDVFVYENTVSVLFFQSNAENVH